MAIMQPQDLNFSDKCFSMILYGSPGVGKTTLALSAPDPILIDFDRGVSRVKSYHRSQTIVCDTYDDVLKDIQSPEVRNCKTVIIDTGGSFVTYLQDWAMRVNPTQNKTKTGTISIKGFGVVKSEFQHFTSIIRDTLHKNLIYIFHSEEKQDKDGNPQQRILCEGSAKNIVWQPCDFGGYVQMLGEDRVITFTPTQEFFAKGCYGIEGQVIVPTLGPTDRNDLLTRLFNKARENIIAENKAFEPMKEQYDAVMAEVTEAVNAIKTVEDANAVVEKIPHMNHALTSLTEARSLLSEKTKALGFAWDKAAASYKVSDQSEKAEKPTKKSKK